MFLSSACAPYMEATLTNSSDHNLGRERGSLDSLARIGYDIYRDGCNSPAFLNMLPPVTGLNGLDEMALKPLDTFKKVA